MAVSLLTVSIFSVFICLGNANEIFRSSRNSTDGIRHGRAKRSALIEKTVCYSDLGCFSTGPPFYHPILRPIVLPPLPPKLIGTQFELYTRRNKDAPIVIPATKLWSLMSEIPWNTYVPTRILVRGYVDNMFITTWAERLKKVLLERADENVVIVKWMPANKPPYTVAVANSRVVGAQVAQLIKFLHKYRGIPPERFHIIGHSLGAHIGGYAGERLQGLGRITGLDPAGPLFRGSPDVVQLDPSDAIFVDIIHTDPSTTALTGLGTQYDSGHLDFYPGPLTRLSCLMDSFISFTTGQFLEGGGYIAGCRHLRAIDFFVYSFNQNTCLFVGVACPSKEDFLKGYCDCGYVGENCALMGFYSEKPVDNSLLVKRRLYLKIEANRPYCVHQYQVTVVFYCSGLKSVVLDYLITGTTQTVYGQQSVDVIPIQYRQAVQFLVTSPIKLGEVISAVMSIVPEKNTHFSHNTKQRTYVESIRVTYLYPLPKNLISTMLCPILGPSSTQNGRSFSPNSCI